MEPKSKVRENLRVFSRGLGTLEAEKRYDKSTLVPENLKPAPRAKNFLAPLSSLSLKYPALKAKESS